jgi:hypothetical protein
MNLSQTLVAAIVGAVGALLGVLVGQLLAARIQREQRTHERALQVDRWKREDAAALANDRKAAYVEYLAACDHVFLLGAMEVAGLKTPTQDLAETADGWTKAYSRVQLLGSDSMRAAAHKLHGVGLRWMQDKSPRKEKVSLEWGTSYEEFVAAARLELTGDRGQELGPLALE